MLRPNCLPTFHPRLCVQFRWLRPSPGVTHLLQLMFWPHLLGWACECSFEVPWILKEIDLVIWNVPVNSEMAYRRYYRIPLFHYIWTSSGMQQCVHWKLWIELRSQVRSWIWSSLRIFAKLVQGKQTQTVIKCRTLTCIATCWLWSSLRKRWIPLMRTLPRFGKFPKMLSRNRKCALTLTRRGSVGQKLQVSQHCKPQLVFWWRAEVPKTLKILAFPRYESWYQNPCQSVLTIFHLGKMSSLCDWNWKSTQKIIIKIEFVHRIFQSSQNSE